MDYSIKAFGAVGDGRSLCTEAIQNAIDECHKNGGGRVIAEDGVFMFGRIALKSNVELHISANATLLGSPDICDYPEADGIRHVISENLPRWKNACYIFADEAENVSVTGMGKIDCNGTEFVTLPEDGKNYGGWKYIRKSTDTPPRVFFFTGCRNVKFTDFTVINQPAGWCFWIHDCDYVTCNGLKIASETEYPNNDGIHINCSRNVTVSNCNISCGDDCIIVRANSLSLHENRICEKVCVTNCNLTSYSAGIRIGWVNDGTIRNCSFSNLVMTDTSVGISVFIPSCCPRDKAYFHSADQGREETLVENLTFNNIVMDKVYAEPVKIFITDDKYPKIKAIRRLYFSNIHATGPRGIRLKGRAENHIDEIYFSDCTFEKNTASSFENVEHHGAESKSDDFGHFPFISFCDRVTFNNVSFSDKG